MCNELFEAKAIAAIGLKAMSNQTNRTNGENTSHVHFCVINVWVAYSYTTAIFLTIVISKFSENMIDGVIILVYVRLVIGSQ